MRRASERERTERERGDRARERARYAHADDARTNA